MTTKYYIEFEHTADDNYYCLQSKWFATKEDAIKWYRTCFDYVDTDNMNISVMKADFDEYEFQHGDILFDEDITTKIYLRSDNL